MLGGLMRRAKINNTALGAALGVNNGTVSRWVDEKFGPSGAEAILLARHFGVTPWELYGWQPSQAETLIMRAERLPAPVRDGLMKRFEDLLQGAESAGASIGTAVHVRAEDSSAEAGTYLEAPALAPVAEARHDTHEQSPTPRRRTSRSRTSS